jgi:hypothetical protein
MLLYIMAAVKLVRNRRGVTSRIAVGINRETRIAGPAGGHIRGVPFRTFRLAVCDVRR